MDQLQEVLQRLENSLKERQQKNDSSPTRQPGLTDVDGRMSPLPEVPDYLPKANNLPVALGAVTDLVVKQAAGLQKETASPQNTDPRPHSPEDKARLSQALSRICALQHQYGKTEAELETLVEGFCWALSMYTMDVILGGIKQFVLKKSDIPAPADIEAILNPPLPKPDWPLYIELKKRLREGNVYVTEEEKRFVRNCEDMAILRQHGELQNFHTARAELDAHLRDFDKTW